jgi:hypothetical protein
MNTMTRSQDETNTVRRHESWDWCAWCWRSDRLDGIGWAAAFLWAALVLLAEAVGYPSGSSWWNGWAVFFVGAGAIVLVETVVRLVVPQYRSSWWWSLIVGAVLVGIGLDSWAAWAWICALAMAVLGVSILRDVLARGT